MTRNGQAWYIMAIHVSQLACIIYNGHTWFGVIMNYLFVVMHDPCMFHNDHAWFTMVMYDSSKWHTTLNSERWQWLDIVTISHMFACALSQTQYITKHQRTHITTHIYGWYDDVIGLRHKSKHEVTWSKIILKISTEILFGAPC